MESTVRVTAPKSSSTLPRSTYGRARVSIEHSIVGTIQINEDQVRTDPIPVHISDSIVDAMDARREAFGAPVAGGGPRAGRFPRRDS